MDELIDNDYHLSIYHYDVKAIIFTSSILANLTIYILIIKFILYFAVVHLQTKFIQNKKLKTRLQTSFFTCI